MVRTYNEAIDWIHSRLKLGIKPGLKRMEWMMDKLGNPERRMKAIHVAGTNGKGSTVCYLRHILQEAGYSVGTFTSPYVEQFNERISVNGQPISDEELVQLVEAIKPLAEQLEKTELGGPTEFEVITAMMFYYFGRLNVQDIVIIEAGLGGRFDSTNVIYPLLSVITNIGYDHMNILGETLEAIAFEKAGIIKAGVPVITAVEQPEALRVIEEKASAVKAKAYVLGNDFTITGHSPTETGEQFTVETLFAKYPSLVTTMFGAHQVKNASLAVMAADYLRTYYSFIIEEEHVRNGIEKAKWIGRFEKLQDEPIIVVDGAHNPEGVASLVATLKTHYQGRNIHVLFSCLKDKKAKQMIEALEEVATTMIFTGFDFPKAYQGEELWTISSHRDKTYYNDWQKALEQVKENARNDSGIVIITGSLYFISEVRKFLLKN